MTIGLKKGFRVAGAALLFSSLWWYGTATGPSLLVNGGFEEWNGSVPAGWQMSAWRLSGSDFSAGPDIRQPHEGKVSLRIDNKVPNDTLCIQHVPIQEGHVYRVSAWVKTLNVQAGQGSIGACLCVGSTWIRSTSLVGTRDWAPVEFYVKTGKDVDRLPVACRLGYWSSTVTGTAWFDQVSVDEVIPPFDNLSPMFTYGIINPAIPTSRARWIRMISFGLLILIISRLILVASGTLPFLPWSRKRHRKK